MKVYWATKLRGFLKHISKYADGVEFVQSDRFYEVSSKKTTWKSKLIRSRIFDHLGIFQIIRASGKDCDFYGSYNRFLNVDKPYFIYLENPTALYHYALGRIKYPLGKRRFKKCLEDPKLKYIICMSDACKDTFEKINMTLPAGKDMKTIYPLVPRNPYINEDLLYEKSYAESLECLYCVQGKRFYTKGGREVLEVVSRLQDEGYNIHLTVITNLEVLDEDTLSLIKKREGKMLLYDFSFPYEELEKIYANTAVLLQPSSDDSCPLTVLEAMKGGCAILGSRLYAIPEMVEHNVNGLLIDPMYWSFTPDNIPNPVAWGHTKKARLSAKRSQKYIDDIENALRAFCKDRNMLFSFTKKSLEIANTKYGEEAICDQWREVWSVFERI